MSKVKDAGFRNRYIKVNHEVRYGYANFPWWKVRPKGASVRCSKCGDLASIIVDGERLCANCQ